MVGVLDHDGVDATEASRPLEVDFSSSRSAAGHNLRFLRGEPGEQRAVHARDRRVGRLDSIEILQLQPHVARSRNVAALTRDVGRFGFGSKASPESLADQLLYLGRLQIRWHRVRLDSSGRDHQPEDAAVLRLRLIGLNRCRTSAMSGHDDALETSAGGEVKPRARAPCSLCNPHSFTSRHACDRSNERHPFRQRNLFLRAGDHAPVLVEACHLAVPLKPGAGGRGRDDAASRRPPRRTGAQALASSCGPGAAWPADTDPHVLVRDFVRDQRAELLAVYGAGRPSTPAAPTAVEPNEGVSDFDDLKVTTAPRA